MFDRYAIETKQTFETSSMDENEDHYRVNEAQVQQLPQPELDSEVCTNASHQVDHGNTTAATTNEDNENAPTFFAKVIDYSRYTVSVGLLLFSLVVVMSAIFTKQTTVSKSTHPFVAFLVMWSLVLWLAVMEGGQGCIVGLQPVDKGLYRNSHPLTHRCTAVAHQDGNVERFIIGRQFLVVLVLFGINACGSAIQDAEILNLPDIVVEIFLSLGVALMLITIIIGQLTGQVNAATCMLDFINNYVMVFTTYLAFAIESSGILHIVYLVQIVFETMSGDKNGGKPEEARRNSNIATRILFVVRVILSLVIVGFAFAVTLAALFDEKTAMWAGVPKAISVIVFFVLMCFVGLMEGMQIALFALVNMSEEELKKNPIAHANCQLVFKGSNFQAFLIGRQICVTICMFLVARITTIDLEDGESTILGVPRGVQEFFNTGFLGAVITTIFASLVWRVVASSFPLAFMSNPVIYLVLNLCLALESSGICSVAWILARIHKRLARFNSDEYYISAAKGIRQPRHSEKKNSDLESNTSDLESNVPAPSL